jgi:hypothetical protein
MEYVNITSRKRPSFACQTVKTDVLACMSEADRRRFEAKVERGAEADCWPWMGSKLGNDGYGQFVVMTPGGVSRKQLHLYAHRVAWILAHGDIAGGAWVLHKCDNPICVNPNHLFLGDQLANMRDASAKGRLAVPRRRTRGIKPTVIARYLNGGVSSQALADEYGVHMLTVLRWVKAATNGADQRAARHERDERRSA